MTFNTRTEAERARFVVERAEQERQAAVIRAEGEGEAATIISKALEKAGEGLIQLRRIEASRDIATTLVRFPYPLISAALTGARRARLEMSLTCRLAARTAVTAAFC